MGHHNNLTYFPGSFFPLPQQGSITFSQINYLSLEYSLGAGQNVFTPPLPFFGPFQNHSMPPPQPQVNRALASNNWRERNNHNDNIGSFHIKRNGRNTNSRPCQYPKAGSRDQGADAWSPRKSPYSRRREIPKRTTGAIHWEGYLPSSLSNLGPLEKDYGMRLRLQEAERNRGKGLHIHGFEDAY